jgi:hypothetical protein
MILHLVNNYCVQTILRLVDILTNVIKLREIRDKAQKRRGAE